jgi:choline dehydrogenase
MFPVVGNWVPSLASIGIESAADPTGGKNYGGFVAALSINPTNWTRSYSKSAYIDPLPPRKNLDILVSATVTRVVFGDKSNSGDQVATGVEFASTANGSKKVVGVKKEVIVTGGALGSPHILMHSGVGPKDVLDAAKVPVVVDLPGVGQHLQDHMVGHFRIYSVFVDISLFLLDCPCCMGRQSRNRW